MKPIGQDLQHEASDPFQPEFQIFCRPFAIAVIIADVNDALIMLMTFIVLLMAALMILMALTAALMVVIIVIII